MSQHHAAHLGLEAGSAVFTGLALGAMATDRFFDGIARHREAAATSVEELALRLREARRDQAAAYDHAAAERQARLDLAAENRLLDQALRDAQRELAVYKSAYDELAARR
jgi:hypothetical protein